MQAARRGIGLAAELAARVQRGEDHLQRRVGAEFRVRIDRDAAPVVADREPVARLQHHFDEAGVAGHRLVHRVVEQLGGEVLHRGLVGAADIHAGPAPHRLQPLQNLDVLGRVVVGSADPAAAPPGARYRRTDRSCCVRLAPPHASGAGESGASGASWPFVGAQSVRWCGLVGSCKWASRNQSCLSRPRETSVKMSAVSGSPASSVCSIAARTALATLA